MGSCAYYDYIISDNNASTRKHLTHSETRPKCKKHIIGYSPEIIPVLQWFSDPAHCNKCVTGVFFELVNITKSIKKFNTLRD